MRLRVEVSTAATELPWGAVLAPGRGLVYDLLARHAAGLGRLLHSKGWGQHGMVPFGYGAPVFPRATRRRGKYAVGGRGVLEFGSPVPELVEALAIGLKERELLDWGGVALRVLGIEPVEPPVFSSGRGRLRAVTPVVLKGSGRNSDGVRTTRQAWLLPMEPEFPVYLAANLRRKAETLDFDPGVSLEAITWVGAKRSYSVGPGAKPGAPVEIEVEGAPVVLRALWSWGLGQANAAGFGWVRA